MLSRAPAGVLHQMGGAEGSHLRRDPVAFQVRGVLPPLRVAVEAGVEGVVVGRRPRVAAVLQENPHAPLGLGLSWLPTEYLSVFAQAQVGTFFFNNRTRARSVGLDINLPIRRMQFVGGPTLNRKFIVVGVEYFDRNVARLAGFVHGPQWYASGRGVAVRFGIREAR